MKKLIGFVLFWIAIGMAIMLLMKFSLLSLCVLIFFLVLGYNMFNCT